VIPEDGVAPLPIRLAAALLVKRKGERWRVGATWPKGTWPWPWETKGTHRSHQGSGHDRQGWFPRVSAMRSP
jgi:hypothetical protein